MTLEQYGAWAQLDFDSLGAHDALAPIRPEEFFNSTEPLGFGTLKLKTFAEYSPSMSSCTVTVTVVWTDAGIPKEYSIQKIFTKGMKIASGGYVDVLVQDCASGTCRGLYGFEVSAPAAVNGNSTAITNAEGRAVLKGVRLGSLTVTAKSKAASPYYVRPEDPSFVRAYLLKTGPSTYAESDTRTTTVTADDPALVVFDTFVPASDIRGRLVLAPDPTAGITDDTNIGSSTKTVLLGNTRAYQGTGAGAFYLDCRTLPSTAYQTNCVVQTNHEGEYVFSNVVPGMVKVLAKGNQGLAPAGLTYQVYPLPVADDPARAWGYANPIPVDVSVPGPTNGTPGEAIVGDIPLKRLGLVRISVLTPTNQPADNCQVSMMVSTPYWGFGSSAQRLLASCDSNGIVVVPNIFGGSGNLVQYNVWVPPTPEGAPNGHNGYYAVDQWWTVAGSPEATLNGDFRQTRVLTAARQMTGFLTTDGVTPIGDEKVWLGKGGHGDRHVSEFPTTVDTGSFTIRGIAPEWIYRETNGAMPVSIPYNLASPYKAQFDDVRFYGTITDADRGTPAAGATVRTQVGNEVRYVTADSSGFFDVSISTQIPITTFFSFLSGGTCSATVCTVTGPFQMADLMGSYTMPGPGWIGNQFTPMVRTNTSYLQNMTVRLRTYRVYGPVTYGGLPVKNVKIEDASSTALNYSDSSGNYFIWATVVDRSATDTGHVQIRVPQQEIEGGITFDRLDLPAMAVDDPPTADGIYRPIALTSPAGLGGI
jgi:hypothetical protein